MDKYKAEKLERQLKGKNFKGYKVYELKGYGKTAAVFRASSKDQTYALKIFDNEVIERFGHIIQTQRIEQEIGLMNHGIKNLVEIIDGGTNHLEGEEYYYIFMEYIGGNNLLQFIQTEEYDENFVIKVFKDLYTVSERLLEKSLAHRDIKPENIMINENREMVLMDLGVLKFVGESSLTDNEEHQFIGTLRYAPPEFLEREEENNEEGWRAINLYQIGGTIHDLIMGKVLFEDKVPYAKLVYAIKDENPKVSNTSYNYRLVQTTRDLLTKDWRKRREYCSRERLDNFFSEISKPIPSYASDLDALKNRSLENTATIEQITAIGRSKQEKIEARSRISLEIEEVFSNALVSLRDVELFKSIERKGLLTFDVDNQYRNTYHVSNVLYLLDGKLNHGFLRKLILILRILNNENYGCSIYMVGMLPSSIIKLDKEARDIIAQIHDNLQGPAPRNYGRSKQIKYPTRPDLRFNLPIVFEGTFENDEGMKQIFAGFIVKLLNKMLQNWDTEVKATLEKQKNQAENIRGGISITSGFALSHKTIIVDELP